MRNLHEVSNRKLPGRKGRSTSVITAAGGHYAALHGLPDRPTGTPLPEPVGAGTEPPPYKAYSPGYEKAIEATARNRQAHEDALAPRRWKPAGDA